MRIVQAFDNGFCFGLAPGRAVIDVQPGNRSYTIHVTRARVRPVTASTLRQVSGNARFTVRDGRVCFGCELNCRQAQSSGTMSNRVVNPDPPGTGVVAQVTTETRTLWPVQPDTKLVDGCGGLIGAILPREVPGMGLTTCSKFQHGMTKILNGEVHVYSFSTPVRLLTGRHKGEETLVSAWLPLRCVTQREQLLDRLHPGTGRLPALAVERRRYIVTGGNPADYTTTDGRNLKIVKAVDTPPEPQDYLIRPGGTANLLYAVPGFGLGGHSLDSFLVSGPPVFRRAVGIRKIIVPTYYPAGHALAGQPAPQTMAFVYGCVEAEGTFPVFGWIAEPALKRVSKVGASRRRNGCCVR